MATYYFRNVGTAWNSNTSWSTTSSSGASAGVIPTAADAVIFDAGSANACPVSTTNGVCLTLTTTGWTGTITLNVNLRVSGSITLSATTTFAGTSYLGAIATGTITSNSVIIPYFMVGTGTAMTLTLSGNLNVTKFQLADSTNAVTYTINANNIFITGDCIITPVVLTGSVMTGTTVFNFTGTTNISDTTTGFNFTWNNNIIINTSGTITFGANFNFGGSAFTYTAGTVDMTTNACLFRVNTSCTWNSGSIVFSTWQVRNNPTITLTSDVIAQTVFFLHTATFTATINGAFKIYVGDPNGSVGNLYHTAAGGSIVTGTATIEFTGKGGVGYWMNWNIFFNPATTTYRVMNWNINVNINTAGTIFVIDKMNTTNNYSYTLMGGSKTFTYTAGNLITKTISTLPGSQLSFKGGTIQFATGHTINGLNKMTWGRIILAGGGTFTMDEFPCGNATVVTQMTSTSTTNYTITLTSNTNRNERIANFLRVKNCTLANANSRQVLITHPKGNLGSNVGLRFGDIMGHTIPKALETNQPKFKSGKEIAYGAMGLVSDPNFASI